MNRISSPRILLAVLVVALTASLLTVASAQPAAAESSTAQPTNNRSGLPVYDTAWELPMLATFDEIETYFDHLQRVGFAGAWVSFFDFLQANINQRSPEGDLAATIDSSGQFVLNSNYLDRVERILDMAQARNLKVSIVPIWAAVFVNGRGNQCSAPNSGPLFDWNAYGLGRQLAERFGGHPAVGQWVMGGDNYCGYENVEIWRQLSYGLADYGAHQPTTYHSPAIQHRQQDNLWENWLDFAAPQTGHCQNHEDTKAQLERVVNATNKPVLAGELRYEGIQPAWHCPEHGPGRPVTADDVEADVRNAVNSGVSGILFGHNERWQWGLGLHGSHGQGGSGALASLGSAGEKRMLATLGITGPVNCDGDPKLEAAAARATRKAAAAAKVAANKVEEHAVAKKKAKRAKAAAEKAAEEAAKAKGPDKAPAKKRAAKKKAASAEANAETVAIGKIVKRTAARAAKAAAAARAARARSAAAC